jgi:molybdopterin synthase catalytic subunit
MADDGPATEPRSPEPPAPHPDGPAVAQPDGDPRLDPPRAGSTVTTLLTSDVLDVSAAHEAVVHPEAGGIGIFVGTVRDHHDGRRVAHLTYEAWHERATAALDEVADETVARHPGVRAVYLAHRIGRLEIGEVSVVCAASAPHRGQALTAAADLIDTVKARVPIWKREVLADGAVRWPGSDDDESG